MNFPSVTACERTGVAKSRCKKRCHSFTNNRVDQLVVPPSRQEQHAGVEAGYTTTTVSSTT